MHLLISDEVVLELWFSRSVLVCFFFFFKQKPAYEMRISDWSSDVCSSDLQACRRRGRCVAANRVARRQQRTQCPPAGARARDGGGQEARLCPQPCRAADGRIAIVPDPGAQRSRSNDRGLEARAGLRLDRPDALRRDAGELGRRSLRGKGCQAVLYPEV